LLTSPLGLEGNLFDVSGEQIAVGDDWLIIA
jgi:hypothetical protein